MTAQAPLERWANMGGPMSRSRQERLQASVLGNARGAISCPRIRRVGLDFGDADPVEAVARLLADAGLENPEALREHVDIPAGPLICRPVHALRRLVVHGKTHPRTLLRQVLILGLSTPYLYDPARPLLLTRASLTRCLELFDGEGYYA